MKSVSIYIRLGVLVIALVLVFVGMKAMTPQAIQGAFSALGVEPGAAGQPGFQSGGKPLAPGDERRTLCRTRLRAIRFADDRAVAEVSKGMKLDWTAEEGAGEKKSVRSIGYLKMEKWLSQHCQILAATSASASEMAVGEVPAVVFEFIDGSGWGLSQAGALFRPHSDPQTPFSSPDLQAALVELRELAGFPVDSKSP